MPDSNEAEYIDIYRFSAGCWTRWNGLYLPSRIKYADEMLKDTIPENDDDLLTETIFRLVTPIAYMESSYIETDSY